MGVVRLSCMLIPFFPLNLSFLYTTISLSLYTSIMVFVPTGSATFLSRPLFPGLVNTESKLSRFNTNYQNGPEGFLLSLQVGEKCPRQRQRLF